jgi:N-acetylmuramoyl-L-alanine amidase/type II secretory pathway predicted ATPase ExeA
MFLDFYRLRQQPFGVTPDPTYLYASRTHQEAIASLSRGIKEGRGFLALIAEPGMGKTTLLYQLLEQLREHARTAFLFQTQCDSREFFQYLLSELNVDTRAMGLVAMHNKLNEILYAELLAGRRFVLVVDESQDLDDSVLETVRLLSNFETANTKLLQIVLAGQPQLADKLAQPQLAQLLQRITVVSYLDPLSPDETGGYIEHRLNVAGYAGEAALFAPKAVELIAQASEGIPRIVNKICFSALEEGFEQGSPAITRRIVRKALRKLDMSVLPHSDTALQIAAEDEADIDDDGALNQAGAEVAPELLTYESLAQSDRMRWVFWAVLASMVLLGAAFLFRPMFKRVHATNVMGTFAPRGATAVPGAAGSAGARMKYVGGDANRRDGVLQASLGGPLGSGATGGWSGAATGAGSTMRKGTITNVTDIEASTAQNQTHIVVALDDAVEFRFGRIPAPDRIYFDLYNAKLSPMLARKTIRFDDWPVKAVRAAQNTDGVVRVVLDESGSIDYSAHLLSNPARLVIDAYPTPANETRPGDGGTALAASGAASGAATPAIGGTSTNASPIKMAATAGTGSAGLATPTAAGTNQFDQRTLTRELGLKISRIVIDPGHGGRDTGTIGPHGLLEKDVCLDVALRLGQLIKKRLPNAEVIYTRDSDRYVSLEERTAIANQGKADLFISIHANWSDDHSVHGVETYYLDLATSSESRQTATRENELSQLPVHDLQNLIKEIANNDKIKESKEFALDVQNSLSRGLQRASQQETNRGVKRAPFIVLMGAEMPAVLSEIAFVSNANDEKLLAKSDQRERMAEGLYSGIANYLESLNSLSYSSRKLVTDSHPGTTPGTTPRTGAAQ